MCTATIAQSILDALSARQKNGSVFTAYDVTKDVRDGTQENIKHKEVQDIVHAEWNQVQFIAGYNRNDMVKLDKLVGSPWAIIYYPDGKSPSDHPLVTDTSNPAPTVNPIPATSAPIASVPKTTTPKLGGQVKDGDDFICSITTEGRIEIPGKLLSQANVVGGTYDVKFSGSAIYKAPNSEGRLRIHKSELGNGDTFRVSVDVDSNTINVEPA